MKKIPLALYLLIGFNIYRVIAGIWSESSFLWLTIPILAILVFGILKKKREFLKIYIIFTVADIILSAAMLTYLTIREPESWRVILEPGLWLHFSLQLFFLLLCFHRSVLEYFNLNPYNKAAYEIAGTRGATDS